MSFRFHPSHAACQLTLWRGWQLLWQSRMWSKFLDWMPAHVITDPIVDFHFSWVRVIVTVTQVVRVSSSVDPTTVLERTLTLRTTAATIRPAQRLSFNLLAPTCPQATMLIQAPRSVSTESLMQMQKCATHAWRPLPGWPWTSVMVPRSRWRRWSSTTGGTTTRAEPGTLRSGFLRACPHPQLPCSPAECFLEHIQGLLRWAISDFWGWAIFNFWFLFKLGNFYSFILRQDNK